MRTITKAFVTGWYTEGKKMLPAHLAVELRTLHTMHTHPVFDHAVLTVLTDAKGELLRIVNQAYRDKKLVKVIIEVTDESPYETP